VKYKRGQLLKFLYEIRPFRDPTLYLVRRVENNLVLLIGEGMSNGAFWCDAKHLNDYYVIVTEVFCEI
jgi:hypothetical protein